MANRVQLTSVQKNKVGQLEAQGVANPRRTFVSGLNSGLSGSQILNQQEHNPNPLGGDNRMPHAGINAPKPLNTNIPNSTFNPPNMPPKAQNASPQGGANFPAPQQPPPNFLPMTPQFEAGRRGLEDQYASTRMDLLNQQNLIQPQINLQNERLNTNQGYDVGRLNENLADRGIFQSGANHFLNQRDIQIPYGRQRQDLANWGANQFGNLQTQLGQANLGYNQSMAELLLNRAADSAQNLPMSVPQYSTGNRLVTPPGPGRVSGRHKNKNRRHNKKGNRNGK